MYFDYVRKLSCCVAIILLVALFSVLIQGCKVLPPVSPELKHYTGVEIYEELLSRQPKIKTYSAGRILISIIDDDQEINIRGAVRISKDSVIMISLSAFAGIEAARIKLTRDSVKIIDRINNIYFSGSYDDSGRFLPMPLSYSLLQGLFFASAINFIGEVEDIGGDNKIYNFENERLTLQIKSNFFERGKYSKDMARVSLDPRFLVRDIDLLSEDKKKYASLNYGSYNVYDGFYLPENIEMYYLTHNLPLKATLRIGRIELNRDLTFPFNVPGRYRKVKN